MSDFIALEEAVPASPQYKTQRIVIEEKKEMPPWASLSEYASADFTVNLHEEILDLSAYLTPSEEEMQVRTQLFHTIEEMMRRHFPESTLHLFGSFMTELQLRESDLDLMLEVETTNKAATLRQIAAVVDQEDMASHIDVVAKAKVPIIKWQDRETGIDIDVSINEFSGKQTGAYINRQKQLFPAFRPLVLVVKRLLAKRCLNETFTGGVGSFMVQMMVLSFLQTVYMSHGKPLGYSSQADFFKTVNLGFLFLALLQFYATDMNYVSVAAGAAPADPQGKHAAFQNKRASGFLQDDRPQLLCLVNPCDTKQSVGGNSYDVMRARAMMEWAYKELTFEQSQRKTSTYLGRILIQEDVVTMPENVVYVAPSVVNPDPSGAEHKRPLSYTDRTRRLVSHSRGGRYQGPRKGPGLHTSRHRPRGGAQRRGRRGQGRSFH